MSIWKTSAFGTRRSIAVFVSRVDVACLISLYVNQLNPRRMIDHAFEYARSIGKVRKNPQHGELEAKLILDDTFWMNELEGQRTEQSMCVEVEEQSEIDRLLASASLNRIACL